MGAWESATGPTKGSERCHENVECAEMAKGPSGGRGNSMGPLGMEEMSWRAPGSGRVAREATGFVGGSHRVLEVEGRGRGNWAAGAGKREGETHVKRQRGEKKDRRELGEVEV